MALLRVNNIDLPGRTLGALRERPIIGFDPETGKVFHQTYAGHTPPSLNSTVAKLKEAMAKAEKPAASAEANPPAAPVAAVEDVPVAEAELVAPKILDAPRPLSKVYGSNWMEREDAAQLKSAFNKAARERTKSLEAYKKYVEESNRRFYASKEYNSPEAVARRNEIAQDTKERLARIAEAKPSWRKQ